MAALYVFPDTNVLLHFQRPDQIDWPTLAGAAPVVIVLASVVIGELDDIKNRQESRKLKQRARDRTGWIKERRRDIGSPLRPNVTLEFHLRENDEHLTDGLVSRVNDDRLIANALAFKALGRDVAVATNDTIAGLKAEERGLRWLELDDNLALPLERDEIEKDRDELKRELDALRLRTPKLEIAWPDCAPSGQIRIPAIAAPPSPQQMAHHFPPMRKPGDPSPGGFAALASMPPIALSASSIDAYNSELSRFYEKYERFYREAVNALDHNRRLVDLRLLVRNAGAASATFITARVELPASIIASEDHRRKELPEEPSPPEKPQAFGLLMGRDLTGFGRNLMNPAMFAPRYPHIPEPRDPLAPEIEEGGRVVTWNLPRLLHSDAVALKPVRCLIAPDLVGQTTQLQMTVHADEQSAPLTVFLDVSFSETVAE